ncbi:MAG: DUF6612 family protein, partial [archaeon]|nr:DUF6612 family protein [archaeon]
YSDCLINQEFLEFLRKRLILLRECLSEQGSIYLHIDKKIGHYVKVIMDEIFGYKSFINDITRIKCNPKNFARNAFGNYTDVILFYVKNRDMNIFNDVKEQLTNEEIKSKVIQVNSELKSYSVDVEMSESKTGQMISKVDIDRLNKRMALKGTIKFNVSGMKLNVSGTMIEVNYEEYILDDYYYTKTILGTWMKMNSDKMTWREQDRASQIIELIQSGTIERLEDETIDDNSYYVIKMNPDIKKVVQLYLNLEEPSDKFPYSSTNFGDTIKSYSSIIWVNKDTFVIERSKTNMVRLKLGTIDTNDTQSAGDDYIDETVELRISNINKEFTITLPEEVKDATDLTQRATTLSSKQLPPEVYGGAITGNIISKIFNT